MLANPLLTCRRPCREHFACRETAGVSGYVTNGTEQARPRHLRARHPRAHDGNRRHLAARLRDGGRLRDRRKTYGRGVGRRFEPEGILPAAVVDWPCLSPVRALLGSGRTDRRQFSQAEEAPRFFRGLIFLGMICSENRYTLCAPRPYGSGSCRDPCRRTAVICHDYGVEDASPRRITWYDSPAPEPSFPLMSVKPTKAMVLAAGLGLRM